MLVVSFNDPAPPKIYTLSLHDALPISGRDRAGDPVRQPRPPASTYRIRRCGSSTTWHRDRKSTRLNSSHTVISYAVFCLKKKMREKAQEKKFADLGRVKQHKRYKPGHM